MVIPPSASMAGEVFNLVFNRALCQIQRKKLVATCFYLNDPDTAIKKIVNRLLFTTDGVMVASLEKVFASNSFNW